MKKWLLWFTLVFAVATAPLAGVSAAMKNTPVPLAKAHAHNDYEHDRPLLDAVDNGFTSVEADVWLVDGKLLVAHDRINVKPDRTLQSLYLDPLQEKVKSNGGAVYPGFKDDFILWIDIKSEDEATYRAIHEQLVQYQKMLTTFTPSGVKPGAVSVYISGNRPRDFMEDQAVRYAAYDGRMTDLETNAPHTFMPVISDNWTKHFTWNGIGEMPEAEREKLYSIVSAAHANGQQVRFWATLDLPVPQREAVWKELLTAGVDFINTDDLNGLQAFLLENDPRPSERSVTWK